MVLRTLIGVAASLGALVSLTSAGLPRTPLGVAVAADSGKCSSKEILASVPASYSGRQLPFAVGERLKYDVSVSFLGNAGHGEMHLAARDTTRGVGTWRATFAVSGQKLKLGVHDTSTSWFDSSSFSSLRFVQHLHDPGYHANRDTQIFPDRQIYQKNAESESPSVVNPMDDVSFVYFVRTLPLEPNQCYVFNRYFKPDGNPVVIHVLRREEIQVPAGKFNAIVIRPEIATSGIFSKGGRAELWLSDDSSRVVLQLKSHLPVVGSLSLHLTRVESAPRT